MKIFIGLILLFLALPSIGQQLYADSIKSFRIEKQEDVLGTSKVLKPEEKEKIVSLSFFQPDSTLVKTVTFTKDKGRPFEMPTSTDRLPRYRRMGYIHFEHEVKKHQLTLYKNLDLVTPEYKDYYFLPFKDLTAPNETYGAGRYIELYTNIKKQKEFIVDFNTAFNPYCVYSYRYSCPITPKENHLNFRIEAGERLPVVKE